MEFISPGDNCVSSLIGLGWVIWFNCKGCVLEMKNGICRKWNQIRKAPHGLELRLELLKWRTCCAILQFLPFGSFLSERALSFRKTERESSEQLRPPLRKWSMSLRGTYLQPSSLHVCSLQSECCWNSALCSFSSRRWFPEKCWWDLLSAWVSLLWLSGKNSLASSVIPVHILW